jgi:hypothetical protein
MYLELPPKSATTRVLRMLRSIVKLMLSKQTIANIKKKVFEANILKNLTTLNPYNPLTPKKHNKSYDLISLAAKIIG